MDARTGELLLAIHHRAYSKGVMGTLEDRLRAWSAALATGLARPAGR